MSRFIGKRVSYCCGDCGKQFTLNRRCVDDSNFSGKCFCSQNCFEEFSKNLDRERKAIARAVDPDSDFKKRAGNIDIVTFSPPCEDFAKRKV